MPHLMAVVEQGGYPNFIPDYQALGLQTQVVTSVRKAIAVLKKKPPALVVAEFNHTPEFRDRVSNVESLLAKIQADSSATKVILFYEKQHTHYLDALNRRFTLDVVLPFPIEKAALLQAIQTLLGERQQS